MPVNDVPAEVERMAQRQRVDVFLASRDAGNTLTLDSLKAGIRLRTVIDAAAAVAEYADEAIAIVNDQYRPALDCKAGCSYCCRKPGVLTTIPELLRILDRVRSQLSSDAVARFIYRSL